MEKLRNYKAKVDKTIYQHNQELLDILSQLYTTEKEYNQMKKIIELHDIGKVIASFQDSIESTQRDVRHEIISASLYDLSDDERLAILTHHKSLDELASKFYLYENDEEYRRIYLDKLNEVELKLELRTKEILSDFKKYRINKKLRRSKHSIILKGLLNYCDHTASAGIRLIDKGFNSHEVYKFDSLTSVQSEARKADADIMIVAPTGSGKTEASLYWASNIDKDKGKRIFYILPFTASINAMYKRLREEDVSVGMLHGKAEYFLSRECEDVRSKYQTFRYFNRQVTVSTIHQIFKAMFNCKFNEMMLAMYRGSTFIIDEIHCYDEKQLALILSTLKYLKENYGVRVCIMSASIPTNLLKLIKSELNIERVLEMTREEKSQIRRHTIKYRDKVLEDDIETIKIEYSKGKKVIVCVNSVKKAQQMHERLSSFVKDEDMVMLHGGFNQRDREKIEARVKDSRVLIGTQAIEVSLDIDYDILFTEVSPIDSQIQRWGRINRKRVEKLKERKDIYIYNLSEGEFSVYDRDIIDRTKVVLKGIGDIDENNIQEYLDTVYNKEFESYQEYANICKSLFKKIEVGNWNSEYSKAVEFSGASVLPASLELEYKRFIDEKDYLKANSLFVNITEGKYFKAIKDGYLVKDDTVKHGDGVITYKYSERLGLLVGKGDNIF